MLGLVFFGTFALIVIASALGVILSRNPVYSALFLVLTFVTSAVLWMLLEAEFLAVVLVLVYVGAVMVLFLFVIMMLDINVEKMKEGFTRYAPIGAFVAFVMAAELATVFWVRNAGLPLGPGQVPKYLENGCGYGESPKAHVSCQQADHDHLHDQPDRDRGETSVFIPHCRRRERP